MSGYWRWRDGQLLQVYALVEGNAAYVGISADPNGRIIAADHKLRRHWKLLILERDIDPEQGFIREAYWHEVFIDLGMDIESRDWFDVCREAGKIGGQTGKKNLADWYASRSPAVKREMALNGSRAARKKAPPGFHARIGKIASDKAIKIRDTCSCGFESNPSGIARHQRASGHVGKTRRHNV